MVAPLGRSSGVVVPQRTNASANTRPVATPEVQSRSHGLRGWVSEFKDKVRAEAAKVGLTAFAPLQPPAKLNRPVVMIPGLTMPSSSFNNLAQHLASHPANGQVAVFVAADGKFHNGGVHGSVMNDAQLKNAKIFELEYRDAKGAPTEKAPQIAQLLREVKRITGAPDLDVVTHSAGGHDFRQYLDTRGGADKDIAIHNTVMIGPVFHGTVMGNVGAVVGGPLHLTEASKQLGIGDPLVKHLDQTWDSQRAQVKGDVTIIAISGAPTMGPGGIQTGDGYVQVDELDIKGTNKVVLHGADPTPIAHLKEVGYTGVVNEVSAALGKN
jgi:uncharacterized alpha/beta hydrolase family protein